MSRGIVYGGVIYFPEHPHADMHGLVRACIRTRCWQTVRHAWKAYEIDFDINAQTIRSGMWSISKSITEQHATETHYGEILVCPLWAAYLRVENYQTIPRSLLRGARATSETTGGELRGYPSIDAVNGPR